MSDICTHQFPLEQFQEALDLVGDSAGASVKVSLIPTLTEPTTTAV
jgi:erythritol/L-threitol dehydrogenase